MDTKYGNILKIAPGEKAPYFFDWNTSPHLTDIWLPQKPLRCRACKNSLPSLHPLLSGGTVYTDLFCWIYWFRDGAWALHVYEPFLFYSLNAWIPPALVSCHVGKLMFITLGHQTQTARWPKGWGEPIALVSALLGQLGWVTSNRRW